MQQEKDVLSAETTMAAHVGPLALSKGRWVLIRGVEEGGVG